MKTNKFQPNWASPPGDTIKDILRDRSMPLAEFARSLGETSSGADALLRGHVELTVKHAKKLESLFGAPYSFWLTREAQYRNDLIHSKAEEEKSLNLQWYSELPLKDMIRFGWFCEKENTKPTLTDCLNFFGVSTVAEWREAFNRQLQLASFRASSAFEHKPLAIAAWLRKGEIDGEAQTCSTWDPAKLKQSIGEIRALSRMKSPADFLPALRSICAKAGVALSIVRAPVGCRASGAARLLTPGKALIQLSFRHLTDDHFWFTFFHEVGHLLLHKCEYIFIDGIDNNNADIENEANIFAEKILIPDEFKNELSDIDLTPRDILRFAKKIGTSPGIVIGQMQNSGRIRHDRLNIFKQRYSWKEIDGCLLS